MKPLTEKQLDVIRKIRAGRVLKRYGYGNHSYFYENLQERVNAQVAQSLLNRNLLEVARREGFGMGTVGFLRLTQAGWDVTLET